jgi:hypothetical protein
LTKEQTQNLTEQGSYPTPIVYVKTATNSNNYRVFRSATDSFQFYYLLGPPQVVLLSGVAQLNPFIYPDVLISRQTQAVTAGQGGTFTVKPFFQEATQDFVGSTSVTFTPNTFFLTLYRENANDPNNLMIVPGGDSYNFTRGSGGDILLTKDTINLNAWYLATGFLPNSFPGSSGTFDVWHLMTEATVLPTSKPIKRSYVNKSSIIYDLLRAEIRLQQYNGGAVVSSGQRYPITSNMLFGRVNAATNSVDGMVILSSGTNLTFTSGGTAVISFADDNGARYRLITGLGTQVPYNGTSNVSPYVINTPL